MLHVCRELAATPVRAAYASASCPQPSEKLIHGPRPGHLRESMSHTRDGVRVAPGNRDFPQPRRQPCGTIIGRRPHLPVARLKRRNIGFKPMEIFLFPAARQTGENVIGAEK